MRWSSPLRRRRPSSRGRETPSSPPRPPSLLRRRRLKRGGNALRVSTTVKFSVLDFAETYLLFVSRAAEEGVRGDHGEGGL